ncbi:MAG: (d)CMP kinase [Deltaproteobacteria bacterium]|nr:(d)CMP kinase [Deltaproteobacteria bacterium]
MIDVITIDGPAGSGKSTVSRLLAKRLNYIYLDTGAMYRAVALAAERKDIGIYESNKLKELCRSIDLRYKTDEDPPRLLLDGQDISAAIRTPSMDMLSSSISSVKEVREAMAILQRTISKGARVVAEGRDMGTIVFPEAEHKFFLTASHEVRAERRYRERLQRGESASMFHVSEEMKTRDLQDENRFLSPLKPAKDAVLIDSTLLSPDEIVEKIIRHLKK